MSKLVILSLCAALALAQPDDAVTTVPPPTNLTATPEDAAPTPRTNWLGQLLGSFQRPRAAAPGGLPRPLLMMPAQATPAATMLLLNSDSGEAVVSSLASYAAGLELMQGLNGLVEKMTVAVELNENNGVATACDAFVRLDRADAVDDGLDPWAIISINEAVQYTRTAVCPAAMEIAARASIQLSGAARGGGTREAEISEAEISSAPSSRPRWNDVANFVLSGLHTAPPPPMYQTLIEHSATTALAAARRVASQEVCEGFADMSASMSSALTLASEPLNLTLAAEEFLALTKREQVAAGVPSGIVSQAGTLAEVLTGDLCKQAARMLPFLTLLMPGAESSTDGLDRPATPSPTPTPNPSPSPTPTPTPTPTPSPSASSSAGHTVNIYLASLAEAGRNT